MDAAALEVVVCILFYLLLNYMGWILIGAGVLVCLLGLSVFFRNIHEEGRDWRWSVPFFILGVTLVSWPSCNMV